MAALNTTNYGVFPLICPVCEGRMRIIAFIAFSAYINKILDLIGACPLYRLFSRGIVGKDLGDMIGGVALAIELGADAIDIGMAAEVAHGSCTDLTPVRK